MSIPEPVGFTDEGSVSAPSVRTFTVLTVNTHKGFTALNRRFILPELRDSVQCVALIEAAYQSAVARGGEVALPRWAP